MIGVESIRDDVHGAPPARGGCPKAGSAFDPPQAAVRGGGGGGGGRAEGAVPERPPGGLREAEPGTVELRLQDGEAPAGPLPVDAPAPLRDHSATQRLCREGSSPGVRPTADE